MISTYRNFISTFLQINTWWYIHTATLYQLSCRWSPDDISIPQLSINFPAHKHLMIYTYRNFISTFIKINIGWYIHTATLYQFSRRWTRDDIYVPQLYNNFPADDHVMIYTYRNFIINFPADEHLMIYTYRNFISIFQQINTWWYIHTATLYQLSCRETPDDISIPQLYINFPPDEHVMIYTCHNFCINFPADEHVMIYTYGDFISTFLQMNAWSYIHTATLY